MEQSLDSRVTLVVPKQCVKTVKQALERTGQLDRSSKITPESKDNSDSQIKFPSLQFDATRGEYVKAFAINTREEEREKTEQQRMCIPTTIPYPPQMDGSVTILNLEEMQDLKFRVLQDLALSALFHEISVSQHVPTSTSPLQRIHQSPVHRALAGALASFLNPSLLSHLLTVEVLVSAFPYGYSVYKPMLLLPHNAFSSTPWKSLITTHPLDSVAMRPVWLSMAEAVGATHVAINSPIPLSTISPSPSSFDPTSKENVLRSPSNLMPLYGDFGNTPTPQIISSPTENDFTNALWVTTRQNGIWQTWAPLYTMFSRGNIREKTRILNLPSVTNGLASASAAVDLYAGIGYFAFSYKKSGEGLEKGIKQVICWEINPWSVEGLRRGAELNGWTCRVLGLEDLSCLRGTDPAKNSVLLGADFIVFQTSNKGADRDLSSLPSPRLPVRHVNLGLLPSSKLSWRVAVAMLDKNRQGWIHVHENVGIKDVETMQQEIERDFQKLVDMVDKVHGGKVSVAHVERVKMYAPGVEHCVFDVCIEHHIQGRHRSLQCQS